jgi:uncharacterized membrane protein YfcA
MTPLLFFFLMFLGSIAAGVVGSIVGIGGGLLITPILTLLFGVDIHLAIGASIVSIIATSSGAAVTYVKDKMTNLRVGMFLEIGTTLGAITGAAIAAYLNSSVLFLIFGLVLIASLVPTFRRRHQELSTGVRNDEWAERLKLNSSYPDAVLQREVSYEVSRTPVGLGIMYIAGLLSGLLGIGSGAFKVLGMENAMQLPMKVSTTTSNFMIGVTAAASAGIYVVRGDVNPFIVAPVMFGVLAGAYIGSKILIRVRNTTIRYIFLFVLLGISVQMILTAFGIIP